MDIRVFSFQPNRTWGEGQPADIGKFFQKDAGDYILLSTVHGIPQEKSPTAISGNTNRPKYKSLNILLVEDTYSTRRQLELILMNRGHHVVTAADGQRAVELAIGLEWDVILMDLQLPILNGWQATEAIRRHEELERKPDRVPIIAQSAYGVSGNRTRSLAVGMNDFLSKPIEPKRLIEVVEQHGIRRSNSIDTEILRGQPHGVESE